MLIVAHFGPTKLDALLVLAVRRQDGESVQLGSNFKPRFSNESQVVVAGVRAISSLMWGHR